MQTALTRKHPSRASSDLLAPFNCIGSTLHACACACADAEDAGGAAGGGGAGAARGDQGLVRSKAGEDQEGPLEQARLSARVGCWLEHGHEEHGVERPRALQSLSLSLSLFLWICEGLLSCLETGREREERAAGAERSGVSAGGAPAKDARRRQRQREEGTGASARHEGPQA
eukprot:358522-Rhodomonas_salina.1